MFGGKETERLGFWKSPRKRRVPRSRAAGLHAFGGGCGQGGSRSIAVEGPTEEAGREAPAVDPAAGQGNDGQNAAGMVFLVARAGPGARAAQRHPLFGAVCP